MHYTTLLTSLENNIFTMKNSLIVFAFFLVTSSYCQSYLTMPTSNAGWQCYEWTGPGYPRIYYYYYMDSVNNDTVINSVTYAKVHSVGFSPDTVYQGAIRDNSNGQVYFIPSDSLNEYLLFDFAKNIGDTISNILFGGIFHSWNMYNGQVVSKDSTLINNLYKRHLTVAMLPLGTGSVVNWIEGIGGDQGLTDNSPWWSVSGYSYLYCMSHHDTTWFLPFTTGFSLGNCSLSLQNIYVPPDLTFSIQPNPFISDFEFSTTEIESLLTLQIIDLFGRCIFEYQLQHSNRMQFHLSSLQSGIYFIKLSSGSSVQVSKILKL